MNKPSHKALHSTFALILKKLSHSPRYQCPLKRNIVTGDLLFYYDAVCTNRSALSVSLKNEIKSVSYLSQHHPTTVSFCVLKQLHSPFFNGNLNRRAGRRRVSVNIDMELATAATGKSCHGRIKYFQYFWCSTFWFLL